MGRILNYLQLARFDRPIGTLLLLWPTLWGLWAAADGFPGWYWLAVFVVGVVVTRALGCVVNDIADYKIDRHVWRTKDRPLAAGKVSLLEAWVLAIFFALIAFALWLWALPFYAKIIALFGFVFIFIYPLTKRFFYAPQLVLGAVFGCGILVADSSLHNSTPSLEAWLLYGANFIWIVAYDTLYAMADKADDARYGKIYSTALLFGDYDVHVIGTLYFTALLMLSGIGLFLLYGIAYQVALLGATWCALQYWRLYKTRNPIACLSAFRANHWFGLMVLAGIIAANS